MAMSLLLFLAVTEATTPISKVLDMLSDLEAKIIKEGEKSKQIFAEYGEWCEDRSRTLSQQITTGNAEVKSLKAGIAKDAATISALSTKLDELASDLGVDEADLKAATEIRKKEEGVFSSTEKELMETIDTLQRAIGIIEREMKGGASMLQLQSADKFVEALSVLVQGSSISAADASKLTALLQASSEDVEPGAPAGDVYKSHSGDIIETLNSLLEKAESQLADLRSKEGEDKHKYAMLKQSLEDEISYGRKEMDEAKKDIAQTSESKSAGEGDLQVISKALAADVESKADLHHSCMTKAEDYEAETKSRGEELKALAEAKKVLKETTGGADAVAYGLNQVSFLQAKESRAQLENSEVVHMVRDLAHKHRSTALAVLAQKIATTLSGNAGDPFGKVKGLIRNMISKLEAEAEDDAEEKAWCDRNLADSRQSKEEKTAEIEKLSTKIEGMSARSAKLKEEVAELQKALSELAQSQAKMDAIRSQEKDEYASDKADTEQGLKGVKMALKVLSEYYAKEDKAHEAAEGAGEGIIGLLEVIESDLTKGLSEMVATEEAAVAAYEQETKENEIEKTTKTQDVKYKSKEAVDLDATMSELSNDRSTVQTELDAVTTYLGKLEHRCVARAETHAERRARFLAEISGLKEALRVLREETAFLQKRSSKRRVLRGLTV